MNVEQNDILVDYDKYYTNTGIHLQRLHVVCINNKEYFIFIIR